jgi:hypothetical protein
MSARKMVTQEVKERASFFETLAYWIEHGIVDEQRVYLLYGDPDGVEATITKMTKFYVSPMVKVLVSQEDVKFLGNETRLVISAAQLDKQGQLIPPDFASIIKAAPNCKICVPLHAKRFTAILGSLRQTNVYIKSANYLLAKRCFGMNEMSDSWFVRLVILGGQQLAENTDDDEYEIVL